MTFDAKFLFKRCSKRDQFFRKHRNELFCVLPSADIIVDFIKKIFSTDSKIFKRTTVLVPGSAVSVSVLCFPRAVSVRGDGIGIFVRIVWFVRLRCVDRFGVFCCIRLFRSVVWFLCSIGWFVSWLVCRLVRRFVGWLICRFVRRFVRGFVRRFVCRFSWFVTGFVFITNVAIPAVAIFTFTFSFFAKSVLVTFYAVARVLVLCSVDGFSIFSSIYGSGGGVRFWFFVLNVSFGFIVGFIFVNSELKFFYENLLFGIMLVSGFKLRWHNLLDAIYFNAYF